MLQVLRLLVGQYHCKVNFAIKFNLSYAWKSELSEAILNELRQVSFELSNELNFQGFSYLSTIVYSFSKWVQQKVLKLLHTLHRCSPAAVS